MTQLAKRAKILILAEKILDIQLTDAYIIPLGWWSELVLTSRETDDGDVDAVVLFKSTDFELSMRCDCIGHNDFFVDLVVDMVYDLVLSYYESMIGDEKGT